MNESLLPNLSPRVDTIVLIRAVARMMQRSAATTTNIAKA